MPLSLLLIPYSLYLLFYIIWSIAILFHLFRYSYNPVASGSLAIVFLIGTFALLTISFGFVQNFDWTQTFDLTF